MITLKEIPAQPAQQEPEWDWPFRVPVYAGQRMMDCHAIRVLEQSGPPLRDAFQDRALGRLAAQVAQASTWWRDWLGMPPAQLSLATLGQLPILERKDFRAAIEHAGGALPLPDWQGQVFPNSTSGSSGVPATFYVSELANRIVDNHYFADHARNRRDLRLQLAALMTRFEPHPGLPHRMLRGESWQGIADIAARRSAGTSMREHALWLHRVNPVYLNTAPTVLNGILREIEEDGIPAPTALRQILMVGETVTPEMRERTRRLMGAELKDRYTCEEIGPVAFQCPHDLRLEPDYHICVANCVVEVVDDAGLPVPAGVPGRVLITGFHHWASPAIRYDLGDVAAMKPQCHCGARIPVLSRLLGRKRFLLRLPSGERQLFKVVAKDFLQVAPVREHRVTQVTFTDIKVELVMERPLTPQEREGMLAMLRKTIHPDFNFEIAEVEAIAWTRSAKRQDTVSLV